MKLSSYLDPKLIFTDLEVETKEEAIKLLIEKSAQEDKKIASMKKDIIKSVLERENEISTAMGQGIAIPHARIEGLDDFIIIIGLLKNPIKCQVAALHKEDDVKMVILLVSEVLRNKRMLKVMSGIMKIAVKHPKVLEEIKSSSNSNILFDFIKNAEVEIDGKIVAEDVQSPELMPVHPNDTLDKVAKRLIIEDRTGLPVVKDGYFLGEITERELIEFGMPKYTSVMQDLNFLTVGEPFEEYLVNEKIATIEELYRKIDVITVDKKTPIMEICFLMVNKGKTRIYVVENGKYYGMIQRSDIIKKVLHI
ncbi:PTS sugar transporter subunit IIA [Ilyobacter polytropus]|uniref:PTS IIA-like nitrogen-regulatory protein PtsN n=1 Tax=Ilyobacter polytropus (strain ATCC 51220 / DSM 2926 / LMG 16218 / CuHBu1) TaxID=572544 RepID=E3H937_ILYPC|nr:PTS sugar transporter subunit IIA [Ilyobacter polytropus]ADO82009.1 putative PTS IIA-like nitrogen-regulatory protein PtsN [Ilyobacter polytropus DSM 2926]